MFSIFILLEILLYIYDLYLNLKTLVRKFHTSSSLKAHKK